MQNKANLAKGVLVGLLLAAFSVVLMGLVSDRNLNSHIRTRKVVIDEFTTTSTAAGWTTAALNAVGVEGSIMRALIQTQTGPVWTSSVGAMDYASKLDIRCADENDDDTLTCTSATVFGTTVLGVQVSETVTGIDESESLTVHAYETVDYVTAVCPGTNDSSDYLVIKSSDHIGLRQKIRVNTDVISVCRGVSGTRWKRCEKGSGYTVDTTANSIDLVQTTTVGSMAIYDDNSIEITVKGTVY